MNVGDPSNSSAKLKVIICDGNRTNQNLFQKYETEDGKPWLKVDGIYLLFDYVHVLNNIRNSWFTEKILQLQFKHDGKTIISNFQHLRQLFHSEEEQTLKMSELDKVSICIPEASERHRVRLVQRSSLKYLQWHWSYSRIPEIWRFLVLPPSS